MGAIVGVAALFAFPILLGVLGLVLDRLPEHAFDRLFHLFGFKDNLS